MSRSCNCVNSRAGLHCVSLIEPPSCLSVHWVVRSSVFIGLDGLGIDDVAIADVRSARTRTGALALRLLRLPLHRLRQLPGGALQRLDTLLDGLRVVALRGPASRFDRRFDPGSLRRRHALAIVVEGLL